MKKLTPDEIYCLNRTKGRRVDDTSYISRSDGLVEKLMSYGYIQIGTRKQSLSYSDMATIRKLLKAKEQKAGGKKVDLVQRVIQCYSDSEIENADIPQRFVLTDFGKQIIKKNGPLLLYLNAFASSNILELEQIISAQNASPNVDNVDLLIELFKEKKCAAKSTASKRVITAYLVHLYYMKHDDLLAHESELEVKQLDKIWAEEREAEARKLDSVLGISLEERRRLQRKAIDEMGDEWEKELDAKNRAKAGIE